MSFKHLSILGVIAAGMMSSCVDNKYDLSDIDTTVRVNVNDLTIPINLDNILMSSIIEESDQIKIIDGQYVVTQNGDFSSSEVKIGNFFIESSEFNPTVVEMPFVAGTAAGELGHFDIVTDAEQFNFSASDINDNITGIESFSADIKFEFKLNLQGISSVAKKVELRDLTLQLPCGLNVTENEGGAYDFETGLLVLPSRYVSGDNLTLTIKADRCDIKAMGAAFDYENHSLEVEGDFYVKSGQVVIASDDIISAAPAKLTLNIDYNIPGFTIKTVTGTIKYDITGVDVSDVDLSDLPDVFNQPGTDIRLANPQIYMSVNNPLQQYGLVARSGMKIIAHHGDESSSYSIDNPYFEIGDNNPGLEYTFCLSPIDPTTKIEGYADAVHVPFTSLSNVLSGNGLPSSLSVDLDNPCVPEQKVTDLALGTNLGEINGKYEFYAPIALNEGSQIVYSDVIDGWSSDDLNEVTIEKLTIKAVAETEIPLSIDFKAYPIDVDGKQINNVNIEGAKIDASKDQQELTITITGAIRHLDGISFVATAVAPANEKVLTPNMAIKLSKIRATVSGYYEKEL